jgi:hypothetical protein
MARALAAESSSLAWRRRAVRQLVTLKVKVM